MARIAIVDDDTELMDNMSAILTKEGYKVSTLADTEGAIPFLVKEAPDVLVLDVMFPENPVGGFDLARQIRRRREIADLPILLLTAVNQEFPMDFSAADIDNEWMPVQDFLEKPIGPAALIAKVAHILEAHA